MSQSAPSPGSSDTPPERPSPSESTRVLLDRARGGNDRAVQMLVDRYQPRLLRWASGRLPAHARGGMETQDLVQDALVRSLDRLSSFQPEAKGAFHGYLRRAVLNKIYDQVRHAQMKSRVQEEQPPPSVIAPDSPLEDLIGLDALKRYETALERLSEEDREVIIARMEMDCPYEELADMLGKPSADAARMSVKRALMRLAKEMDRSNGVAA